MKSTRVLLPGVLIGALLLTGCSSSGPTADATGEDCLASGAASEAVKVSGDFGAMPEVNTDSAVQAEDVERSVITEGKGDVVATGDTITLSYSMFNGATGNVLEFPDATGENAPAFNEDIEVPYDHEMMTSDPVFGGLLRCATEGQRAIAVVPVTELVGDMDPADAGLTDMTAEDSVVIVADTTKIVRGEGGEGAAAEEEAAVECETFEPRDEKYPEVDLGDGSSEPTITIPECIEAPTDIEIEVLEEGDGAKVEDGEEIMTNYVGVDWNGAVRFDGNWSEEGIPFSTAEGALIEGFRQAMIGQNIGSTVLVTMPSDLGYNDGMTRTFVLQLVSKSDSEG